MSIKRLAAIGAVALVAVLSISVGLASADAYTTGLESPTFTLGTVNGQDGWHSAAGQPTPSVPALPNGYDQAVVNNSTYGGQVPATADPVNGPGFGNQSLRLSNAYTSGEFYYQTYSKSTTDNAGESEPNKVFDGSFQFISTSASSQPGLDITVSPDDGRDVASRGARMSWVELLDVGTGIQIWFSDTLDGTNWRYFDAGTYAYDKVHTVEFLIQTVPGENADGTPNDIVRLYIDGTDIGNELGECFTTWEQYYRNVEFGGHAPGVINSFEFRAGGTAVPSLLGHGYLFDNVSTIVRNTDPPAPTSCGLTGAFCSPGFWKNASDTAWDQVSPITKDSLFNNVVVPNYYANDIGPGDPTLWDVLTAKSANKYGKPAGPFGLNPYNAVGAALTSAIPGYVFDPNAYAQSLLGIDTCPLDNHGNLIAPT